MTAFGRELESGAHDLLERGQKGVLKAPSATLSALVIRFRWGDSVLEIEVRRSTEEVTEGGDRLAWGVGMMMHARVPRTGQRADVLVRYPATALADLVSS